MFFIVEYARVKIFGCTAPPPRNAHNDVTPDNILISFVFSARENIDLCLT